MLSINICFVNGFIGEGHINVVYVELDEFDRLELWLICFLSAEIRVTGFSVSVIVIGDFAIGEWQRPRMGDAQVDGEDDDLVLALFLLGF